MKESYEARRLKETEVKDGRLKWSCRTCHKRNDTKIPLNTVKNQPFACTHCHKVQIFMFTPKAE